VLGRVDSAVCGVLGAPSAFAYPNEREAQARIPGEMLAEEFLKPLGMSNYRLAKEIGVPRAAHRRDRRRQARHHR